VIIGENKKCCCTGGGDPPDPEPSPCLGLSSTGNDSDFDGFKTGSTYTCAGIQKLNWTATVATLSPHSIGYTPYDCTSTVECDSTPRPRAILNQACDVESWPSGGGASIPIVLQRGVSNTCTNQVVRFRMCNGSGSQAQTVNDPYWADSNTDLPNTMSVTFGLCTSQARALSVSRSAAGEWTTETQVGEAEGSNQASLPAGCLYGIATGNYHVNFTDGYCNTSGGACSGSVLSRGVDVVACNFLMLFIGSLNDETTPTSVNYSMTACWTPVLGVNCETPRRYYPNGCQKGTAFCSSFTFPLDCESWDDSECCTGDASDPIWCPD